MLTLLLTATLLVGAPLSAVSTEDPARPDWPRTRAERTENQETSTLADVEDFIAQLIARGAPIRRETLGISAENREIPLVICADPMVASGAEARATGRLVIYLQANIHGGEIEGKEVVQMLLRELAAGVHPQWLTRCVFVCTPIYNTDGNEAWGPGLENRAHQNGPPIVGRRPNGQGLDLNRDCMKASSPEMRAALTGVYRHWDPHVVLDLHTTNGTRHGYSLTYAPPLHPDTDPEVLDFAREQLLPEVRRRLKEQHGELTNDYGNVQIVNEARGWGTFSPLGRYVSNYAGLRGRIGVLSEATSFLPLETRIRSTKRFVTQVLNVCTEQAGTVAAVCRAADARGREGSTETLSLKTTLAARGEEAVPLERKGEERAAHESPGVIVEATMPIYDRFVPTRSDPVPRAYWIPAAESEVIALLRRHGIEVEPCRWSRVPTMEAFTPDEVRGQQTFQGVRMRRLSGNWAEQAITLEDARRGYTVSMRQPLARLIFHLLEPESGDGVIAWGMVRGAVEANETTPIRRVR